MRRIVKRVLFALSGLVAVSVITVYAVLRGSLPQLDGEIAVAGAVASVTVERDARGIPTITGSNRDDVAFTTGFVHGQDRFFQMDLTRRKAAGELSQLFGSVALDMDRSNRFHRFRARAEEVIAAMTDRERSLMTAYVAGVNEGLQSLGATPFEYVVLGEEPAPWRIADSLLVVYAMFMELNDERASRDVKRGLAHRVLPEEVFAWMYPDGTDWDAPIMGGPRDLFAMPGPGSLDLRHAAVADAPRSDEEDGEPLLPGSNNWAVGGKLTATGRAIVANDMHLNITTPNIFYRARLIVTGDEARDVTGVTLPGTPVVVAGSNGTVAWGFTNSYGDWTDAILLQPGDEPGTYRTPDGPGQIVEFRERIEIKGGAASELVVRETMWGPILDDVRYPDGEVAVSWIAHHAEAVNVTQVELETAGSVVEAISIANRMGIPPQNFVTGDAAGNIGWTIAGRIPRRPGGGASLPVDWSDGQGWAGWLAADEYPRVVNPEDSRIWTANARVADGEALRVIGDGGYDLGARARQIRDRLFDQDDFAPVDMLDIQFDDRALFLDRWQNLLLEVLDDDALAGRDDRALYRQLVDTWIPRASVDSVGYRLVRSFRAEVRSRVFDMLTATARDGYGDEIELRISNQFEGPLWQLVTERPAHLLTANYGSWRELLLAAVDEDLDYYAMNFSDGLASRTWGERNTASIRHPLSRALSFLSGWLDMPGDPLTGDTNMPKAQGPAFGASERFAVSPGDEENGYLHMPAGQSGHPLSDFYRIGHDDWVRGRPSRFLPGPTEHRLVLSPAS